MNYSGQSNSDPVYGLSRAEIKDSDYAEIPNSPFETSRIINPDRRSYLPGHQTAEQSGSGPPKQKGDTTMTTITRTMLIGALLAGLAPVAHAAQGSKQSTLDHQYYGATAPVWSHRAESAYAQQWGGRGRIRTQVNDNPPGSAWQDRGIREDNGYPSR